jgi:plasmid stabilization system protein ParE
MLAVIYHPEAQAELIEAAKFYHDRVPGLGADLLGEVDRSVGRILQTPTRWRTIQEDIRRYYIERFPCSIIYRVEGNKLRILAFKHNRRKPEYWKHRKT